MKNARLLILLLALLTLGQAKAQGLSGSGTTDDPYLITSSADWTTFAQSVTNDTTYAGQTVKLTADISVSTMAGSHSSESDYHAFSGTFDGDGHTITLALSHSGSSEGLALFSDFNGATLKNLKAQGTVITTDRRPATFVIFVFGNSTISNCWSTVDVSSTRTSGWVDGGGMVGRVSANATLNMTDCAFHGSVAFTPGATSGGGMIGFTQSNATVNLTNCLYSPTALTLNVNQYNPRIFVSGNVTGNLTNCYYNAVAAASVLESQGTNASGMTNAALATALGVGWLVYDDMVVPFSEQYNISSTAEWNAFATALNNGISFSGRTVTLTADIAITTMAGVEDKCFAGTFEGQGHTITINMTASVQFTSLFCNADSATFQNLKVDGTINTSKKFCAGIVGAIVYHGCTFINCVSDVTINSSINGDGTHGGLVAYVGKGNNTFEGCAFTGKLLGANTNYVGGLVGFTDSRNNATVSFTNCVFHPQQVTMSGSGSQTFARWYGNNSGSVIIGDNCYYSQTLGGAQGKQMRSITGGNYVTVAFSGNATTYERSGISAYSVGIVFGSTLYAGNGDTVSLNLSCTPPSGYVCSGYTASAGTLTGTANPYTLTMPNEAVTIQAVLVQSATPVSYMDGDGTEYTCNYYTVLTGGGATTLAEGWYVVDDDITYTGTLTLEGNVNLILCDGKTMMVNPDSGDGIFDLYEGYALTVYGQTLDSLEAGTLYVTNYVEEYAAIELGTYNQHSGNVVVDDSNDETININGDFTINGGTVNATGFNGISAYNLTLNGGIVNATVSGEGLNCNYLALNSGTINVTSTMGYGIEADIMTLNGGSVNVTGNRFGINSYNVTINGGTVTANDIFSPTVTLGWSNLTDRITVGNFFNYLDTPTVSVKSGQAFYYEYDDETVIVSGTLNEDQIEAIGGKTLIPYNVYPVAYIDENGVEQQCTSYTIVTDTLDFDNLPAGWYVVSNDITLDRQVHFTGDALLILCDGATMNISVDGSEPAPELSIDPMLIFEELGEDDMTMVQVSIENAGNSIGEWTGWLDFGVGDNGEQTADLFYHNGEVGSDIGFPDTYTQEMGIRLPGTAYAGSAMGMKITSVQYYIREYQSTDNNYIFRIYGQGLHNQPGELLAEKTVYSTDVNQWITATFDEEIYMTGQVMWATVQIQQAAGDYSLSMDGGEYGEESDGNWLSTNGDSFSHCYSAGAYGGAWLITVNCQGEFIPATWATIDKTEGAIMGGQIETITLMLNSISMADGEYNADLIINTNDEDMAHVVIPVFLDVSDGVGRTVNPLASDYPNPANSMVTLGRSNTNNSNSNGDALQADGSLTLYCQSAGTGSLTATSDHGHGINATNLTINGGTLTTNEIYSPTVTLGWSNTTDRITVGSFAYSDTPTVSVKSGQAFFYYISESDETIVVSDTLTTEEIAAIGGKTLRPYLGTCTPPFNLEVTDIFPTTAILHWMGETEGYNVRYYKPYFFDSFEEDLSEWTIYKEGDPASLEWGIENPHDNSADLNAHSGYYAAVAYSDYDVHADSWLVTPQIQFPNQTTLKFWIMRSTYDDAKDEYEVRISNTGNAISDFTTILKEKEAANPTWTEVSIDLSEYDGQQCYIAIRHDFTDGFFIMVDDFGIYGWSDEIVTTAESLLLEDLLPETEYQWKVQGVDCDGNGGPTEWSETATFTTLDENTKVFVTEGEWSDWNNWEPGGAPSIDENVILRAEAVVFDVAEANSITIEGTATLTIEDGGQLKTNNPVNATVMKHITGYGHDNNTQTDYYLFTTPIVSNPITTDPTTAGLITTIDDNPTYDLYRWDRTAQDEEWQNYKVQSFNMSNGTGYLYANANTVDLYFTGTIMANNTDYTVIPAYSEDTENGWNLYGNPFVCDAYLTSNTTDMAYYILEGEHFEATTDPVASMQGVFIQTPESGKTVTFSRTAPAKQGQLNLSVNQGNTKKDNVIVRFGEGNTLRKLSFFENSSKLFITMEGKDYAVVNAGNTGKVPVSFNAENNGTYTLSFNFEDVTFSRLRLIDHLTGEEIDLLAGPSTYTFDAHISDASDRFTLVYNIVETH